jgi:cytochrome oxidase Cu insertion factor (SCO1/SenC/PrrC family)
MNILNALQQLRDDIKTWVTNNLNALNAKIDEKTIPIDSELSPTSTNPVQNKAISKEIEDINDRVGTTSVATQIKQAIDTVPTFSGDYNDLTNAPNITEDDSGNMVIADESGNIIFKADADGLHTTELTLNGESAATESYVDNAIANIEFPETDLTDYATKKYVDDAVDGVDFTGYATETYVDNKVADLVNSAPEALNTLGELATALENHEDAYDALLETVGGKATHDDLENMKTELSESIVSEQQEFHVVDENGNIVTSIDENGVATTTVTAQSIIVNGDNVEEHIDNTGIHVTAAEKEAWNNKSNFSGSYNDLTNKPTIPDLTGYATKEDIKNFITEVPSEYITETELNEKGYLTEHQSLSGLATEKYVDDMKVELSESIVSEQEEFHIVDNEGHIVTSIDNNGVTTTTITAENVIVNGANVKEHIDDADIHVTTAEKEVWNNKSDFSGNYNDLSNKPTLFSGSYNDLTDKPAPTDLSNYYTKTEVDTAIENVEVDLTGYATEEFVNTAISNIDFPETDLTNYYTKTETDTAIESAKEELSESIVSESEEWHVVDNNGNIVATIDASGISTTTVAAQNITINGLDIEELIQARVQAYIDQAILGGEW